MNNQTNKESLDIDPKKLKLGAQADLIKRLKDEREAINKASSLYTAKIKEAEGIFIDACKEAGTTKVGGLTVTATISEEEIPDANIDWDLFYKYIVDKKAPHMLYRRPTLGPLREIWSAGGSIPGVSKVTQKKVATRSI